MRLEQISMFLSQGKASVMVGAGFSKNAQQMEFAQMKDWGELTDILRAIVFWRRSKENPTEVLMMSYGARLICKEFDEK